MRALTEQDHEQIFELAEQGASAREIASRLGKNASTVQWFLYSAGLRAPRPAPFGTRPGDFHMRGGRRVYPFTEDEDRFIEELRSRGEKCDTIARLASAAFGTERTRHTIRCRLVMLAAREEQTS